MPLRPVRAKSGWQEAGEAGADGAVTCMWWRGWAGLQALFNLLGHPFAVLPKTVSIIAEVLPVAVCGST